MQITQWIKKWRIRLVRSSIIKKASQDEHHNQTTITTNIKSVEAVKPYFAPQNIFN